MRHGSRGDRIPRTMICVSSLRWVRVRMIFPRKVMNGSHNHRSADPNILRIPGVPWSGSLGSQTNSGPRSGPVGAAKWLQTAVKLPFAQKGSRTKSRTFFFFSSARSLCQGACCIFFYNPWKHIKTCFLDSPKQKKEKKNCWKIFFLLIWKIKFFGGRATGA